MNASQRGRVFFKPDDAWAGDFIPFFWQGVYHLFYLKDFRGTKPGVEGIPWHHVSTKDFVRFTDHGVALPQGSRDEQDLYVFTGSVMQHDGTFHIFYTGHNPQFPKAGKAAQAILHATSRDLITWSKQPSEVLCADPGRYEVNDWRDPFVFYNSEAKEHWMLVAARLNRGPSNRRGCIALAASDDLKSWEVRDPFWAPRLCAVHECPDLFRWGRWWYLVYSTFTERFLTQYRMSRSLSGPWRAPANDSFDGRAFYAAKTAGDGRRRFAFGWNATRAGESDEGEWQWGGSLVVHELVQSLSGALGAKMPPEIGKAFRHDVRLSPRPRMGRWRIDAGRIRAEAVDGFAWCSLAEMPDPCLMDARIAWPPGTRACGIILRADEGLERYYQVRVEPGNGRVVFDRWPRPGDKPFVLERPLPSSRSLRVSILTEGSMIEAYFGGQVTLSTRGYAAGGALAAVFVSEGKATFSGARLRGRLR